MAQSIRIKNVSAGVIAIDIRDTEYSLIPTGTQTFPSSYEDDVQEAIQPFGTDLEFEYITSTDVAAVSFVSSALELGVDFTSGVELTIPHSLGVIPTDIIASIVESTIPVAGSIVITPAGASGGTPAINASGTASLDGAPVVSVNTVATASLDGAPAISVNDAATASLATAPSISVNTVATAALGNSAIIVSDTGISGGTPSEATPATAALATTPVISLNAAGTCAGTQLNYLSASFSGTGITTAAQDVTTTDNQTMLVNECAGMWLIADALTTTPPVMIVSNTAVTGAPAVFTVIGVAPVTDGGNYRVVSNGAAAFTDATYTSDTPAITVTPGTYDALATHQHGETASMTDASISVVDATYTSDTPAITVFPATYTATAPAITVVDATYTATAPAITVVDATFSALANHQHADTAVLTGGDIATTIVQSTPADDTNVYLTITTDDSTLKLKLMAI